MTNFNYFAALTNKYILCIDKYKLTGFISYTPLANRHTFAKIINVLASFVYLNATVGCVPQQITKNYRFNNQFNN